MDENLYSIQEVATHFRVCTMTVYRWIREGTLNALRVGRQYRVRQSDLTAFESAQR